MQQMGNPTACDIPINLVIPANSMTGLAFWGYRLLCYGVNGIGLGSSVSLILFIEKYGQVKVTIEIGNPPG
jgi:hypothetical protein